MKIVRVLVVCALVSIVSFGPVPENVFAMDKPCATGPSKELKEKIIEMAERSKKEKKGLTLYLPGQSIPVIVTEVIGTEAIVGKNGEYDRILIRLDRVLGYAMN